ncbi:MAG TPA: MCE family protein [Acidimicrobiales bacterium]|nr:MCE family protein [Acidimicrobiales bacterium]
MSRSILARLIALFVVTVVGAYYIAFDAVGVKLTNQPFTVRVMMPAAGGVYSGAYVTYRGVEVGRVSALHLQQDGVVADLSINQGARIPVGVTASVRELTAAAEQYMDLVPPAHTLTAAAPAGRYLHQGSVIPRNRVTIPVSVGTLLNTLNTLVDSLHASDLNTLSSALATGLQNAGADLHSIIVNGDTLVSALQSAIPGTTKLIDSGNTVLSTFNGTNSDFQSFAANLNELSAQVARSNPDLIALLKNGAVASQSLSQFLSQNGGPTVSLINDLASATGVAYARRAAVQALFQVLPLFSSDVAMVTTGGQIRFELTFNYKNTVCPYTSTMAEPTSLIAVADLTRSCATEAPDLLQRGADKAPPPQG